MTTEPKRKSIRWMVGMLMLAVAGSGWGFSAGIYASAAKDFRATTRYGTNTAREWKEDGLAAFFWNAVVRIPEAPEVLSYTFRNHRWLPITVLVLEVGAGLLGVWAARLQRDFAAQDRRFRRAGGSVGGRQL